MLKIADGIPRRFGNVSRLSLYGAEQDCRFHFAESACNMVELAL